MVRGPPISSSSFPKSAWIWQSVWYQSPCFAGLPPFSQRGAGFCTFLCPFWTPYFVPASKPCRVPDSSAVPLTSPTFKSYGPSLISRSWMIAPDWKIQNPSLALVLCRKTSDCPLRTFPGIWLEEEASKGFARAFLFSAAWAVEFGLGSESTRPGAGPVPGFDSRSIRSFRQWSPMDLDTKTASDWTAPSFISKCWSICPAVIRSVHWWWPWEIVWKSRKVCFIPYYI